MGRHFRPSVYNGDKGRAAREKRLADFLVDYHAAINRATEDFQTPSSVKLGPGKSKAQALVGTYACAEQGKYMGGHWRGLVDAGCQKKSNPKAIGKYQQPEPVTVTSARGVMSGSYRNQNGNPITDAYSNRYRSNAEYKRQKRQFRKVVDGLTIDRAAQGPDTDTIGLELANEKSATDYRKYFR